MGRLHFLQALGLASLLLLTSATHADNSWLHGTGWYADSAGRIVEGEDKDGMHFEAGGTVYLIYGSGKPYLRCRYATVTAAQLNLDCTVRGEPRRLKFVIDPSRTQLANVEDTDNGFYTR